MQHLNLITLDPSIFSLYERIYDVYFEDLDLIPEGNFYDIQFEKLERNPVQGIKNIYKTLDLDMSEDFLRRLENYVTTLDEYKKNDFAELNEVTKATFYSRLRRSFDTWGYPENPVQNELP